MYNRRFFASKLGHAALVSIAAMVTFVALSSQPPLAHAHVADANSVQLVELA